MTPDCCKNCKNLTPDGLCRGGKHRRCPRWRDWLCSEWARIRRAVYNLKYK